MSGLRLVFDVSCLGYGALRRRHRTGLFRVAEAYARELRAVPGLELGLYSSSGNRVLARRVLKELGWERQPWVGQPSASSLVFAARSLELLVYRSPFRPFRGLLRALVQWTERRRLRIDSSAFSGWQAYLSPMEAFPLAAGSPGLLRAVVVHDLIPIVLPEYRQDPADPTRWFSRLWSSLSAQDLVFSVSESTRQDLLKHRPDLSAPRVAVAPNAVDPRRFFPGAPDGRYFLAVSTLEPRKRLDALLAGYARYRQTGGTLRLLVGGTGAVSGRKNRAGVEFLGYVKDEALPDLYRGCTGFLSLSEYEGFGLPILEAMACGAPVVVSPHSSHPEVAGGAGVYIDPDDAAEIARALHRLADDSEERARLSRESLLRAAAFSWEKTVALVVARIRHEKDQL